MTSARLIHLVVFLALTAAGPPVHGQAERAVGGELRVMDSEGKPSGACPLKFTDVTADVVGFFGRVTVRQTFENPFDRKIEAVYVFPLPQHAAVDDLVMTIGDRRIVGRIKPRDEARDIYETARAAGHVAALLDQERPNIFTQSVANIEPGARVVIEISYVETLKYEDGAFEWVFPMVVGPRYIPGGGSAPAPGTKGTPTPDVPDADRITPPVTPKGTRAGHDIRLKVNIDAGMPLFDLTSPSHEIVAAANGPNGATVDLLSETTIPNKDFILRYRLASDDISDAFLVHEDERGRFFTLMLQPPKRIIPDRLVPRELIFVLDTSGSMSGYPMEKAKEVMAGAIASMQPFDTFNLITFAGDTRILWDAPRPATDENIAAARQFLSTRRGGGGTEMMKAINAALIQPGSTGRPLTPDELAGLTPDGREVVLRVSPDEVIHWPPPNVRSTWTGLAVRPPGGKVFEVRDAPAAADSRGPANLMLEGRWQYTGGRRILTVERHSRADAVPLKTDAIRVVCFMTDGYVGNDMAIIGAVRKNAGTTRVFSFGIGSSVNRFLLDGMAAAGRGEVEYVTLAEQADAAVERFHERILAPVLTDIQIDWNDLPVADVVPASIPDLFSAKPLVIHGRLTGPADGTITLRGNTGGGAYESRLAVSAPPGADDHEALATLWARAKVADLMMRGMGDLRGGDVPEDIKNEITTLGVEFRLMTQFTSFVAVEELTVTLGGEPTRVDVPVEMPEGVSYEGVFGQRAQRGRAVAGRAGAKSTTVRLRRATGQPRVRPALERLGYLDADEEKDGRDGGAVNDGPAGEAADDARAEAAALRKLSGGLGTLADKVERDGEDGNLTLGTLIISNYRVNVMIFLRDLSDGTRESLNALGFHEAARSGSVPVLIGTMDVRRLRALARLEVVVRVKPLTAP